MEKNNTVFAIRLRDLREEAGLSMMELARAIGVSDAAICKWENGNAEPKLGYIIRLAEFFDCSTDYLIGKDGDHAVAKPTRARLKVTDAAGTAVKPMRPMHVVTVPDDAELLSDLHDLTPDMRAALRETIKALGGKHSSGKRAPDGND